MDDYLDHPEWLSLISAIYADPEDDLPRLTAADWLEFDAGQYDRAEFIRVSCEASAFQKQVDREGLDASDPYSAAGERAEELWRLQLKFLGGIAGLGTAVSSPNARAWFGEPLGVFQAHDVQRGFPFEVRTTFDEWRAHGPTLTRSHFVRTVTFVGPGSVIDQHYDHESQTEVPFLGEVRPVLSRLPVDWLKFLPKGVPHSKRDEKILASACAIAWARAPRRPCDCGECGGLGIIVEAPEA